MRKIYSTIVLFSAMLISCGNNSSRPSVDNSDDSTKILQDSVLLDTTKTDSVKTDTLVITQEKKDTIKPLIKRPPVSVGPLLVPSVKVKGIYVTGPIAGSKRMKEMVELVTSTEMNAIVLDVKNDGGNITYKIQNEMAQAAGGCCRYVKDMPGLLRDLHEKGIYVIGRIVCFKDPYLAKYKPELALIQSDGTPVTDGKGLPWVNPYKKEVWDYLCGLAEQASADGFDEIQFDYVRFPIVGKQVPQYGVDLATFSREQCLTEFFAYVQNRLHAKNIVFGADLFGTVIGSPRDRDLTGQDYARLATMTDALCPMIYPSHYAKGTFGLAVPDAEPYQTIYKALLLSKEQLKQKDTLQSAKPVAVVRPWLQCFSAPWVSGHISYKSKQIKEQIQAVYDAGYEEWILWNAANHYEVVADALKQEE